MYKDISKAVLCMWTAGDNKRCEFYLPSDSVQDIIVACVDLRKKKTF